MDFVHLPQISPAVRRVRVLGRVDARSTLVYMATRGCIGLFCRNLRQVQLFTALSPHDLVAVTLPEKGGNVRRGSSSWHLEPEGRGTRIIWESTLAPDFWVPPILGPPLVRAELRAQGKAFLRGIERYAAKRAAGGGSRAAGSAHYGDIGTPH